MNKNAPIAIINRSHNHSEPQAQDASSQHEVVNEGAVEPQITLMSEMLQYAASLA
jgi:hypothetical protein